MTTPYGRVIRKARKAAGKTLGDVASYLHVSVSYISDIERGNRKPLDDARTERLARYLSISEDDLLEAAAKTQGFIKLPLAGCSDRDRTAGEAFARRWRHAVGHPEEMTKDEEFEWILDKLNQLKR